MRQWLLLMTVTVNTPGRQASARTARMSGFLRLAEDSTFSVQASVEHVEERAVVGTQFPEHDTAEPPLASIIGLEA
jgi:hypothetical protein